MTSNGSLMILAIPFVAAFIGWLTNLLAVRAMLYPVHFVGLPPVFGYQLFGWQGLIPKNSEALSLDFSKLIREELLDVKEVFQDLRKGNNEKMDEVVDEVTDKVLHEIATKLAPEKWQKAREKLRAYIEELIRSNICDITDELMEKFSDQADDIIDIDAIMSKTMREDRALMGRIISSIAHREFRFLEMSGLYFGFLFGIVQMLVWIYYPAYWVLPAAGFLVGYTTNWLALHLTFEPKEPTKIGPFTVQGVFIKRRHEVAISFADILCDTVFSSDNMRRHLNQEPARSKVTNLVEGQIDNSMKVFDDDPMVAMLVTADKLDEAKDDLRQRIRNADMEQPGSIQTLMSHTDSIRDKLVDSLGALTATQFSSILRPVFQKDEWKLTVAGGVIGIGIGTLQYVYLFSGSF